MKSKFPSEWLQLKHFTLCTPHSSNLHSWCGMVWYRILRVNFKTCFVVITHVTWKLQFNVKSAIFSHKCSLILTFRCVLFSNILLNDFLPCYSGSWFFECRTYLICTLKSIKTTPCRKMVPSFGEWACYVLSCRDIVDRISPSDLVT